MNSPWAEIVPVLSGLAGVLIGGWITSKTQQKERRAKRIKEQLDQFYGPLLGMRAQILAKSEVRLKVSGATSEAWRKLIGRFDDAQFDQRFEYIERTQAERFPDFQKVIDENNRQLIEDILPMYRKMVKHFADNMSLSESSTRQHFGALVEFVEIWDRWLNKTIPGEAIPLLGHSEDNLKPFYQDLGDHMNSLGQGLNKKNGLTKYGVFILHLLSFRHLIKRGVKDEKIRGNNEIG